MDTVEDNKTSNPFFNNYVFSKSDLKRIRISRWRYPFLWLSTTYLQLADGYEFHFKMRKGRIYLMKIKEFSRG